MNYFLGIDIGTTSAKAVAFSEKGEVLASFSFAYDMHHPTPKCSEQNPDEILQAVINGMHKIQETFSPQLPQFISFSAAMHSIIAIDNAGKLLTQCIIWADNRSDVIAQNLKKSSEGFDIYNKTGVPIHAMSPLCKLLWLRENDRTLFNTASKFVGIKEYIFYKLFGTFVIDTSVASATGLLNTKTLNWDISVLDYCEVSAAKLSEIVSTESVFYYKGNCPGLTIPATVPFVIGASDGACSNLGTGATDANTMAVTIGTSSAARMIVDEPCTDKQMRTFCYHVKNKQYIIGGANNNGAVILQWLKDTILESGDDYQLLFKEAATIPAGSNNLLFLPYLLGERAPLWNSNAKGVFFGLTIQHTKAHMIRAAMEGVVFALYSIGEILAEVRNVSEVRAAGGFAKSELWLQMLADISNVRVAVSSSIESSALGAVMLGAEALSIKTDFQDNFVSVHEPDPVNHDVYIKRFQKFQRLYDKLSDEMNE